MLLVSKTFPAVAELELTLTEHVIVIFHSTLTKVVIWASSRLTLEAEQLALTVTQGTPRRRCIRCPTVSDLIVQARYVRKTILIMLLIRHLLITRSSTRRCRLPGEI